MISLAIQLSLLALLTESAVCLDNGVAITSPMGWNPYNAFACDATEADYRAAAEAMVKLGLKDFGYQYVNLDCGWQSDARAPSGTFMWNSSRIPNGIPALAEYVHSLGLKFGIYSDAGYYSCDAVQGTERWIGSLNHEQSDADTFSSWGMDYLKYDNCYSVSPTKFVDINPDIQEEPHYTVMRNALNQTGREVVYSLCEWGLQDPARWAGSIGNTWRVANDDGPPASFASVRRILNQLVPITKFAGPGAWNDLDLLEVGNDGMSEEEWKTQFAFWAAAKSPLIISTDLSKISNTVLDILTNKQLIEVNQDPLGRSIDFKRRYTDDFDVWAGELADGSMVALLLNWRNQARSITFNLSDVGLVSANLTNLWNGTSLGYVNTSLTATVGVHGTLAYKLTHGVPATPYQFKTYYANASANQLTGKAHLHSSGGFVNGTKVVRNIGNGGTLTYYGVDAGSTGGTKLVSIVYINANATFANTICPNCRQVEVSVNDQEPVWLEMPLSGQDWGDLSDGYLVSLDGFKAGPSNKVRFGNPDGWAPDMYSIGVQV